jgi:hypothetical protein
MLVSSTGKPQAQQLTAVSCPVLSYPAVQSSTRVSVYLSQELDARLLRPLHLHTITRLLCHSADRAWRYCPRLGVRSREPHRLVCGHAFRGRYPVGAPAHHQPIRDAGSERLLVDECRAEDYSGGHRTRGDACQVRLCWCALVRDLSALSQHPRSCHASQLACHAFRALYHRPTGNYFLPEGAVGQNNGVDGGGQNFTGLSFGAVCMQIPVPFSCVETTLRFTETSLGQQQALTRCFAWAGSDYSRIGNLPTGHDFFMRLCDNETAPPIWGAKIPEHCKASQICNRNVDIFPLSNTATFRKGRREPLFGK